MKYTIIDTIDIPSLYKLYYIKDESKHLYSYNISYYSNTTTFSYFGDISDDKTNDLSEIKKISVAGIIELKTNDIKRTIDKFYKMEVLV